MYMKHALIALLMLLTITTQAQDDEVAVKEENVPAAVVQKLRSMYPDVTKTNWTKEKGRYLAAFTTTGHSTTAEYDSKGNWIESEMEITKAELPEAVNNTLNSKYAGYKTFFLVKTSSPKQTFYEISLKGAGDMDVLIDEQGNVLEEDEDD